LPAKDRRVDPPRVELDAGEHAPWQGRLWRALLADAGHNLSDVLSLLLAWAASEMAKQAPTLRRTYGYRKGTILASLANAGLLLLAVGAIVWEAVRRFGSPDPIQPGPVMVVAAIGVVGGVVEAESRIITMVARSPAPLIQKLSVLLRLAAGETAPLGPAAERARAEAVKLFRAPESRVTLSAAPEALVPLKGLMQAAGLAA
jgi:hypothetical protein